MDQSVLQIEAYHPAASAATLPVATISAHITIASDYGRDTDLFGQPRLIKLT
jgi:hypothetical protein